jgi:NO-binding membrane sensor protein with MHYT domain
MAAMERPESRSPIASLVSFPNSAAAATAALWLAFRTANLATGCFRRAGGRCMHYTGMAVARSRWTTITIAPACS